MAICRHILPLTIVWSHCESNLAQTHPAIALSGFCMEITLRTLSSILLGKRWLRVLLESELHDPMKPAATVPVLRQYMQSCTVSQAMPASSIPSQPIVSPPRRKETPSERMIRRAGS